MTSESPGECVALVDLADRGDVESLLRRFYGRALFDDLLAAPFAELRTRGLESHLPVMCDFWETALFHAGSYRGNALNVHRQIHGRTPLSIEHFLRWLALWNATVDELYRGPVAERAKLQASRIALAMSRRLTGDGAAGLNAAADFAAAAAARLAAHPAKPGP